MKYMLAAALFLGSVSAAATTVEVGTGDWRNVPVMRHMVGVNLDSNAVAAIHESLESGECVIPGQSEGHLDMTVPFLVLFTADGAVDRLVIEKMGCAKAEGILAGALLKIIKDGAYRPVGGRREGWFRSEVSFAHS
jgi:hypothetical protein